MRTLLATALLFSAISYGQLADFNAQRYKIDKDLMLTLGSWATVNIVGSGIAWANATNDEMKYFHQMNTLWNTINLGLAIPGVLKAKHKNTGLDLFATLDAQRKTETVFLVNAGFDLAYISGGLLLRGMASSNASNSDQFTGYGNSLLIQGGFLLFFDWIAYGIHRKHSNKELSPLLKRIDLSGSGIGLKIMLD
jgi:hypothetical protein